MILYSCTHMATVGVKGLKELRLVADLVLTDSLFQTAGAAMEKKRETSEVEVNS